MRDFVHYDAELAARRAAGPQPHKSDAEIVKLLVQIKDLALSTYPQAPDAPGNDPRLILALGQIAGLAVETIGQIGDPGSARRQ